MVIDVHNSPKLIETVVISPVAINCRLDNFLWVSANRMHFHCRYGSARTPKFLEEALNIL